MLARGRRSRRSGQRGGGDKDGGEEPQTALHARALSRNVLLIRAASAGSPS
jgi:hypothetical protein